ncbi:putative methyltransferase DPH5 [Pisolithus sp. B1]|nr:putative methyltransferase DPH5 [Pisolithus sp. B1]
MVETQAEEILHGADKQDVSLLIVTYPFGATTHIDIVLRVRPSGIPLHVIHNTSIMNAIGVCGLQLYNFGQMVSLVFFTNTWKPDPFYNRIRKNMGLGLHTLVLLDIKAKEQMLLHIGCDAGSDNTQQCIVCGTLEQLSEQPPESFGEPLHSLIIVGKRLHHLEVVYAEEYAAFARVALYVTLP